MTTSAQHLKMIPTDLIKLLQVFKAADVNHRVAGEIEQNGRSLITPDDSPLAMSPSSPTHPNAKLPASLLAARSRPDTSPSSAQQTSPAMPNYSDTFQKHLQELQNKALLKHQSSLNPFADMMNPLQFGYNPFLMQQYAGLAAMSGLDYMNPYASLMMPYLPDVMKNLTAHPTLSPATPHRPKPNMTSHSHSSQKSPHSHTEEEIKIPAYKPAVDRPAGGHSSPIIPDLSSHLRSQPAPVLPDSSAYFSQLNHVLSRQMKDASRSRSRKHKLEPCPSESPMSASNGIPPGKKRPKRGQYRKYDSELLAQAVRAVQRGEMSVHRAGTFYGVPHSTLEYKVKERHLLRKKKIAEGNAAKAATISEKSSAGNSSNGNTSDSEISEQAQSSKEEQKNGSIYSQSEIESATPGAVNYSMNGGSSFGEMDTSATDLLRKLQAHAEEKAQQLLRNSTGGPVFQEAIVERS